MKTHNTVDEYIKSTPVDIQEKLMKLRKLIHKLIPHVQEKISYGMPTFYLKENLVHFAYYKKHIGFYPTPGPIKKFENNLELYKFSKGAIQFPVNEKLPIDLITKIIRYRLTEEGII